jgi:cell wall-associated NlpC family hydrolase
MVRFIAVYTIFFLFSCVDPPGWNTRSEQSPVIKEKNTQPEKNTSVLPKLPDKPSPVKKPKDTLNLKYDHPSEFRINTGKTTPRELLAFANSLLGVRYLYASTDPSRGFDCSGFITYVFNHFNITVPRSSIEFTNVGQEINPDDAKPGEIILFTGTDSTEKNVGHMGIVTSNNNKNLEFIHSTSGKANGVTITPLSAYYRSRFVKVIRVFKQNNS